MRRAAKVDDNQREIVAALRSHGATVIHLHAVGKGCPDILVGYRNENYLMEIKDGEKSKGAQKLTPDQVVFFSTFQGRANVVNSITVALSILDEK